MFQGIMIDRGLTWAPHTKYSKKKLQRSIDFARLIWGTTWGNRVKPLLQLYQPLFLEMLSYTLPISSRLCKTNLQNLQSIQRRALSVCLGLPQFASAIVTIAKARSCRVSTLKSQETIRPYLGHPTQHDNYLLDDVLTSHSRLSFVKVLQTAPANVNSIVS